MKTSKHQGAFVVFKDEALGFVQCGDVVGESRDGRWTYVRADAELMKLDAQTARLAWHMRIASERIPAMIQLPA
jgi:hypothetical protein